MMTGLTRIASGVRRLTQTWVTYLRYAWAFRVPQPAIFLAGIMVAGLGVWWSILLLLDSCDWATSPSYATNLHMGMWIYLVEFLLQSYRKSFPLSVRSIISKSSSEDRATQIFLTIPQVGKELLWRLPLLILGTALLTVWFGNTALVRLAALTPNCILPLIDVRPLPERKPAPSSFIRGTHLGSQRDAAIRAAQLRADDDQESSLEQ